MDRYSYDANEAMSNYSWQSRQGRPEEWQREERPVPGTGVVLAVSAVVVIMSAAFALFMLTIHIGAALLK